MMAQAVKHFPHVWMTCIALVLFLGVFAGVLTWIFRRNSRPFYEKLSRAPLAADEEEGK